MQAIVKKLPWLAISFALVSCAYQPQATLPEVVLPDLSAFAGDKAGTGFDEQPKAQWWQAYNSDDLNNLYLELNANSLDLAAARERLGKARALQQQQHADNWPSVNAQFNQRSAQVLGSSNRETSSGLNFNAAYEVDLWGSRSAANYGAEMGVIAERQEFQSLRLQLQGSLARYYFDYLAVQDRYAIALQNQQASKELLDVIHLRFEAGSASGIELNQQRNTWLATAATVLDLERASKTAERSLAVLLGRESLTTPELKAPLSTVALPNLRLVQSAALLEYRPDIQLAESQLRLSEAALYQEKRKRWPSLELSAGIGLNEVLDGGTDWATTLIGTVAAPIFDAGKIRQQIEAAGNDFTLAQLNYRAVVLRAMQDTLETLSELAYQKALYKVREMELENNQQLYALAKLRYESGDTDFINLLTAQRSWFSSRDSLLQAKNQQLAATVNLFAALGVAPEQDDEAAK